MVTDERIDREPVSCDWQDDDMDGSPLSAPVRCGWSGHLKDVEWSWDFSDDDRAVVVVWYCPECNTEREISLRDLEED